MREGRPPRNLGPMRRIRSWMHMSIEDRRAAGLDSGTSYCELVLECGHMVYRRGNVPGARAHCGYCR